MNQFRYYTDVPRIREASVTQRCARTRIVLKKETVESLIFYEELLSFSICMCNY